MGPMGVRATSPPRCDYTSRVRFTQTYRDGRGSQEVSIAPSLDSSRLRIGRNGPIIALWVAVQPAKSLILGTTGLIDPLGPRLHPPNLYINRSVFAAEGWRSVRRFVVSTSLPFRIGVPAPPPLADVDHAHQSSVSHAWGRLSRAGRSIDLQ